MAEQVPMIALSPTMEEGTIVRWAKSEGDPVTSGDLLCEVETDKATMEYESSLEGTLLKILVPEGGAATVSQVIAIVGEEGEDITGLVASAAEATKGSKAEAPSDSVEVESPQAAPTARTLPTSEASTAGRIKASPLARRMAEQRGIDIAALSGSGPGGRIIKRDLDEVPTSASSPMSRPAVGPAADEIIPVTGKRKIIAQRLSESKFQAPHYYLKLSIAMDDVLASRARLNAKVKDKVSLNAFIVKIVAEALKRHPAVNAAWEVEAIRRFGSIDVGMAVAVPDGLITPIVRDCGNKGILDIDREFAVLIGKARDGKLQPEDYQGATFTISNLGMFGIEDFTAIINPPGSAILTLGKIQKEPVFSEEAGAIDFPGGGSLILKSLMRVSLSCDHRVIDGASGAAFLADLKAMMEEPVRALY